MRTDERAAPPGERTFRGRGVGMRGPYYPNRWDTFRDLRADTILVGAENGQVRAGFRDGDGWHEIAEIEEETSP